MAGRNWGATRVSRASRHASVHPQQTLSLEIESKRSNGEIREWVHQCEVYLSMTDFKEMLESRRAKLQRRIEGCEGQQDLMFRSIIAIAATIAILGGCASANEMLELEPRAKFQAKNELPQFGTAYFDGPQRASTLEYNQKIFSLNLGGPMYLISQDRVVSVYVHWNMIRGRICRST